MSNNTIEPSEEWRPVVGIDGYLVSNLGRVRSILPRKGSRANVDDGFISGWVQETRPGYFRQKIAFRIDKKTVIKMLHHVVLEAFVSPCPPGQETLHGNGNSLDNRLENLRWGTHKENVADCIAHGTKTAPPVRYGESHHNSTLTSEQVDEIRQTDFKRGVQASLARKFGVAEITISRIRKGISRSKG